MTAHAQRRVPGAESSSAGPNAILVAVTAAVWLASAVAAPSAHARAGSPLRCTIPKISVCDGCLRKVIVTGRANGNCRVTFEVSPAALSADAVPIEIVLDERTPFTRRVVAARPPSPVRNPGAPGAPCFVFNGARYCE